MDDTRRGRGTSRQEPPSVGRGAGQGAPRGPRNDRQPQSRQNQSSNSNNTSRADDGPKEFNGSKFDTDIKRDRDRFPSRNGPPVNGNSRKRPREVSRRDSGSASDQDRPDSKPYQDGSRKRRALDSPANGRPVPVKDDRAIPLKFDEDVLDIEGEDLAKFMGFSAFRTTKNTKVPGNEFNYGVSKVKASQYRQYMNRVGGFNRPLSPTRGNKFAKPADTEAS